MWSPPSGSTGRRCRTCGPRVTVSWIWVGSSSPRGGTPPYLGPYFAAKAAEDALAVSYADHGAEDVFRVGDRVRQWFYQRIGLSDLLTVDEHAGLTGASV